MYLKNKKILFIAPAFYSYHTAILNEMTIVGANVDFFRERPDTLKWRFSKKTSKKLQKKIEIKYLQEILNTVCNKEYDYFFLIRGEIITPLFLQELRAALPKTKFIMYQWDSDRVVDYVKNIIFFDKVITFDMKDAASHGIGYLPLFFTKEYEQELRDHRKTDLIFIGYYHTDRLRVIKKLIVECDKYDLQFEHYIYLKKLVVFKFLLQGLLSVSDLKYINTQPLSAAQIAKRYKMSKAVLDIENYNQNGLTMRSIEVLGSDTKLVTTNSNITNEVFFDKNNIFVVDRDIPKLNELFFNTEYNKNTSIKELSIDKWIKNIFAVME